MFDVEVRYDERRICFFLRISESVIYLLLPEEELMFFTEDKVGALLWDILMALRETEFEYRDAQFEKRDNEERCREE